MPFYESLRVHGGRTIQRQILHLGELNTRQERSWRHTLDVINQDDDQLQPSLRASPLTGGYAGDKTGQSQSTNQKKAEHKLLSI
ncbi:MAG: hypothetical protein MUF04_00215 [Akkermansiaceae bacterium]|jgi:hypothetical protein|nr:hypothetical protein [Akkermansiaceae bacterium]